MSLKSRSVVTLNDQWISSSADAINDPAFALILEELKAVAAEEDAGTSDIGRSIDLLRANGLLADDGRSNPEYTAQSLMRIGSANLSVGRLLEGHINALYLVNTHGSVSTKHAVDQLVSDTAFLGVWGADGKPPLECAPGDENLAGGKNFASGLGVVTHAVVTVNSGSEVKLAIVDVTDADRGDCEPWQMLGMRATRSGTYGFVGVPTSTIEWIGGPGDYLIEPHFIGGVWRIACLQLGATIGLLDDAASQLRARGRMQAEAQKTRLTNVLVRALAAASLVERAARQSVSGSNADKSVALSISARLLTEEIGLDAIKAVEQCLGLSHFADGSETGRMARDLSVYMRQAARDAFLLKVADQAFDSGDTSVWDMFS